MSIDNLGIDVQITAEMQRFEDNLRRAGRVVETATSDMDRSTRRAAQEFARLEASVDPVGRAAQRLENRTARVQRALDAGAVSTERAARVQRLLNDQYEQTVVRLNSLGVANTRAERSARTLAAANTNASTSTRRFGGQLQNASFQVGDFFTQVAAGTNASRALGQQLPQLLGGFGALGAAFGAAAAAASALVPALFGASDGARSLEGAMRLSERAAGTYQTALRNLGNEADRVADALAQMSRVQIQAEQLRIGAELEIQRAAAAGLRREIGDLLPNLERLEQSIELNRLNTDLTDAERAAREFEESMAHVLRRFREGEISSDGLTVSLQFIADQLAETDGAAEFLGRSFQDFLTPGFIEATGALTDAEDRVRSMEGVLSALGDGVIAVEETTARATETTRTATAANDDFSDSFDRLLERLDPTLARQRELEDALGLLHEAYNRGNISLAEYARLESQVRSTFEGQAEAAETAATRIANAGVQAASVWASAFDQAATAVARSLANSLVGLPATSFDPVQAVQRVGSDILTDFIGSAIPNPFADNFSFSGFLNQSGSLGTSLVSSGLGQSLGLSSYQPSNFFSSLGINTLQPSGFGSFLQSGLNDFSSPVSVAGNFATSLALDAILGNRGVGASIGQGLGSLAGSFIGGPAGSVIGGALGNIVGGLFGGNRRPPDSTQTLALNFANDNFGFGGSKNPTAEQQQLLQALGELAIGFDQLVESLGGDVNLGSFEVGLTGKYSDFIDFGGGRRLETGTRNDIGALESLLLQQVVPAVGGLDDPLQRVLNRSSATNFTALTQELAEAGQFLELYNSLVDEATLTDGEIAIKAINEQFEALFDQARRMGLALEPLIELRDEEIAAIEAQASLQPQILADTLAAGEAIKDFLDAQSVSALSSLSPTERLAEAQSQFGADLDLVRGGDLNAIGSLTQSAQNLLTLGRDQYASSLSFAALETSVRSSLANLGVDLTSDAALADRTAQAVEAQTVELSELLAQGNDERRKLRDEFRALSRRIDALAEAS